MNNILLKNSQFTSSQYGTILSSNTYTAIFLELGTPLPSTLHTITVNTTKANALVLLTYRGHLWNQSGNNILLNFTVDGTPVFVTPQWGGSQYWQDKTGTCIFLVGFISVPTAGSHAFAVTWQSANNNYTNFAENATGYAAATARGNSNFAIVEY
jgi:hypothetical protein